MCTLYNLILVMIVQNLWFRFLGGKRGVFFCVRALVGCVCFCMCVSVCICDTNVFMCVCIFVDVFWFLCTILFWCK